MMNEFSNKRRKKIEERNQIIEIMKKLEQGTLSVCHNGNNQSILKDFHELKQKKVHKVSTIKQKEKENVLLLLFINFSLSVYTRY